MLGDSNAVLGCDRAEYEASIGPLGSGAGANSENSLRFRDFARSQKLRTSGFWYQHSDLRHRYSDVGNAAKEINHIVVGSCWKSLQNCRVYRNAEFCGTDHRFVVANLRVHFKTRSNNPRMIHLDRLGEEEAISGRFTVLGNLMAPQISCGYPHMKWMCLVKIDLLLQIMNDLYNL